MKLKPCPFCGRKKYVMVSHSSFTPGYEDGGTVQVDCIVCRVHGPIVSVPRFVGKTNDQLMRDYVVSYEEKASKLWNRRAEVSHTKKSKVS